jgi:hypothetical protein
MGMHEHPSGTLAPRICIEETHAKIIVPVGSLFVHLQIDWK